MKLFDQAKRLFKPREGSSVDALLESITALAKKDTIEERKRFYRLLSEAILWMPTSELSDKFARAGSHISDEATQLQIVGFDVEGRKRTPVFTDEEALRSWDPNTPSVGLPAKAYFGMIVRTAMDDVVLNPFQPNRKMIRPGAIITRLEFQAIAEGMIPTGFDKGGVQLTITTPHKSTIRPATEPLTAEQRTAILSLAENIPRLRAVFHYEAEFEHAGVHRVIGLEFRGFVSGEQTSEIIRNLGQLIQKHLRRGESIDFTVLNAESAAMAEKSGETVFSRLGAPQP
jgi:SseB protein N-terminal domain